MSFKGFAQLSDAINLWKIKWSAAILSQKTGLKTISYIKNVYG